MTVYNIHEAKTQLSKLIAQAEAGEEVIIARNGAPVVKLSPVAQPKRDVVFGQLKGLMSRAEIEALLRPDPRMQEDFEAIAEKPLIAPRRMNPAAE